MTDEDFFYEAKIVKSKQPATGAVDRHEQGSLRGHGEPGADIEDHYRRAHRGAAVARDYQGLNDLDDHIAGQERMAIAQNEILQFASEALSHFECIEVSRCTLANIEVLRQEGAARLVAAEKIDSAMKELISAILGYAATDPLRGFGQSRLKTAWNFHCHSARYRDFPRHVQGSIQAMTEPLGVAQARSTRLLLNRPLETHWQAHRAIYRRC